MAYDSDNDYYSIDSNSSDDGEFGYSSPTSDPTSANRVIWEGYLADVLAGNAPSFTPKDANFPSYETWLKTSEGKRLSSGDDANPAQSYLTTYYNVPDNSDEGGLSGFLNDLPIVLGLAGLGAGAYAGLSGTTGAIAGAEGVGALAGGTATDTLAALSAADTAGLTTMAADAGLTGATADAFVASGGTLGSTAAGLGTASTLEGLADLTNIPTGAINPSAQAIDGSAQTIYDAAANAGVPGYDAAATSGVAAGGDAGSTLGTVASAASSLIPGITDAQLLQGISGLLQGGLGYLGADASASALTDIYNQQRADRAPALEAYNSALASPDTWYNSAPSTGALDAVLRKLSVQGNPANNPGLMEQAAAYNLGGYSNYLNSLAGAAFGTAGTEATVGTNAANAGSAGYNAIGYGLGTALKQPSSLEALLSELSKNYSLNVGGNTLG